MQIVWRFDVAMTMVATIGKILAAWILWQAVFLNHTAINGFSFDAMLSYYIIGSILSSIDFSHQISDEVSGLIRNGRFSGHMVTPMNPLFFFGSMTAGESAFHLGFSLFAAVFCTLVFGIDITLTNSVTAVILSFMMILIGLVFMACYHYTIGILTFKFLEIGFFMHIQGSVIAFATGALVPLAMLPDAALLVFRFLPFTHVIYTPVMLLCGQADIAEGFIGLGVICVWALIMFSVSQYTYGSLRVRYDGVGI